MTCQAPRCSKRLKGRSDQRYCSTACRMRALRRRNGEALRHRHESYTPPELAASVRRVLRGIDLDPCSTEEANSVVRARRFITEEEDGLSQLWRGRLYVHPPFCGEHVPFILKLREHFASGDVSQAIALIPNQTDRDWFPWAGSLCFVRGRVRFWGPDSRSGASGSVFVYLGPHVDKFRDEFSRWGPVARTVSRYNR
jgi:hypothetical protein